MQSVSSKNSDLFDNQNVSKLKTFISEHVRDDGDFWSFSGDEDIFEILDQFDTVDWNYLKKDLIHWTDAQLTILAGAIAHFDTDAPKPAWIFAYIFTILNDLKACYWLLQELDLLYQMEPKDVDLLYEVKGKIELIRRSHKEIYSAIDQFDLYQELMDKIIASFIQNPVKQ